MYEVVIRRAGANDAPVLVDHNLKLAEETEGIHLNPLRVAAGVLAAVQEGSGALYYVAERDGNVIGQLMVTFEWSDWRNGPIWWIQSVYIRREDRRRGVFRQLFHHVRNAGTAVGAVGFRLYVEAENHAAQATYRSLGFIDSRYTLMELFPAAPDESG